MEVKIGPYSRWYNANGLESFYYKIKYNKHPFDDIEYDEFDLWFNKICDSLNRILNLTVNKIRSERKLKIKIHDYDSWNADQTLANIILPLLIQLKEQKNGAPQVDNVDVPKHLRAKKQFDKNYNTDGNWFARWDYVLDEMIWAFTELLNEDGYSQFHHNLDKRVITWKPTDESAKFFEMISTDSDPDNKYYFDKDGCGAYDKRIQNGLILFGKYYRGMWS